jgi:hypothetical protein
MCLHLEEMEHGSALIVTDEKTGEDIIAWLAGGLDDHRLEADS